jgi:hypothetical protein
MSVRRISVRAIMPPPPTPWIERPDSISVKLWETPHMIAPAAKKVNAANKAALRPNECEKETNVGWKTVDVRRNEVPAQKASIAVP